MSDASFERRKEKQSKESGVLQVEGMAICRRTEAERRKSCVGDGKISMPVATKPYMGVTKKIRVIFPPDAHIHLNFTVESRIVTSSSEYCEIKISNCLRGGGGRRKSCFF
jgi:hypothetical protein